MCAVILLLGKQGGVVLVSSFINNQVNIRASSGHTATLQIGTGLHKALTWI